MARGYSMPQLCPVPSRKSVREDGLEMRVSEF